MIPRFDGDCGWGMIISEILMRLPWLRIESVDLKIERVEIFDVVGKKVFVSHLPPAPSEGGGVAEGVWGEVDILHLSSGMYFVRIQMDKGTVNRKVVKK